MPDETIILKRHGKINSDVSMKPQVFWLSTLQQVYIQFIYINVLWIYSTTTHNHKDFDNFEDLLSKFFFLNIHIHIHGKSTQWRK